MTAGSGADVDRLVEHELVVHIFLPLSGPHVPEAVDLVHEIWRLGREELGVDRPIPATGLPDVPSPDLRSEPRALAARLRSGPRRQALAVRESPDGDRQMVLRREHDLLHLAILSAAPRLPTPHPPDWNDHRLLLERTLPASDIPLGTTHLYLAKTTNPSPTRRTAPTEYPVPSRERLTPSDERPVPSREHPTSSDGSPVPSGGRWPVPSRERLTPSNERPVPSGEHLTPSDGWPVPSGEWPVPPGEWPVPSGGRWSGGWWSLGVAMPEGMVGWEFVDDEPERAGRVLVVVAPQGKDAVLGAWTWSRGDPEEMPVLGRYQMHMAKLRYEMRVRGSYPSAESLSASLRAGIDEVVESSADPGLADRLAGLDLDRARAARLVTVLKGLGRTARIAADNAERALGPASRTPDGSISADLDRAAWFAQLLDDEIAYLEESLEGAQRVSEIAPRPVPRLDARSSTAPDARPGPGPEAGPGSGPEAGPGIASGVGPKTGADVGPKTWPDTGSEAGPGIASGVGPKAGPSTGSEAGPGTGSEAGPGTGSEAGANAGPKAGSGTRQEAGTGTGQEARTGVGAGRGDPTVGIVTALPEEFAAVRALLDGERRRYVQDDRAQYLTGTMPSADPGLPHRLVLTLLGETGNDAAAEACANLARSFRTVGYVLMVGIAAGVPDLLRPDRHVRLGDIVVSTWGIVDYDHVVDRPGGAELRQPFPRPSPLLARQAKFLEAEELAGRRPWEPFLELAISALRGFERPSDATDLLYPSDDAADPVPHPAGSGHRPGLPKVHQGFIGSADRALRNAASRDGLAAKHDLRALEMEGKGIGGSGFSNGLEWLVVRGISDYGDQRTDKSWRNYASVAAAAYSRALLAECPPLAPRGGHTGQVHERL